MCQPWDQYVLHMLYNIIILEPSTLFYVTTWLCDHYCDHVIWCDWCVTVWLWCHYNPNPRSKNKEEKRKKKKKKKLNEKTRVQASHIWQI